MDAYALRVLIGLGSKWFRGENHGGSMAVAMACLLQALYFSVVTLTTVGGWARARAARAARAGASARFRRSRPSDAWRQSTPEW